MWQAEVKGKTKALLWRSPFPGPGATLAGKHKIGATLADKLGKFSTSASPVHFQVEPAAQRALPAYHLKSLGTAGRPFAQ